MATRMRPNHFTARENQVMELIAQGCTDKEIASRLSVSPKTIATHVQRILTRQRLHTRASAVAIWLDSRVRRHDSSDADLRFKFSQT